ncbi:Bug family tripartite tricarboxylate transporter substrate binding protein [Sediminicoccus rosea]|jgi:tripartite-type tricarboxylate transporter receptor subunit TctC|uniref:Tripartite tricarboxylate transporter substrate binding protein n=1 Tax=Sediminicoccus rosea TaxID=1225128 RepID=A0ABZ0PGY2_9PROT|nr:tripartite tricarboxylate transporter substrate binding protein [Sediminicoccus rosea]WPB84731.1 tripartite tricarboxylate transporter substrate binding protein [Sediminicoccus rosea]
MKRRALLASSLLAPGIARAQAWPDRPIRLVVPFPGGSSTDILGRIAAQQLSRGLNGATVVIDNRAGAGGTIGSHYVAQAAPDGLTLLLGTIGTHTVNPHLMPNLPYDPMRDFTPIIAHSKTKILLVVRPQLGVRSMAEFVALARTRPLSVASSGTGTTGHLAQALLGEATGITTTHVPYRDGARAVTDLLSGQIDSMFYHTQFVRSHIEAGTMLGLGITGATRSDVLPGVPTFGEAGLPAINIEAWWALYAPPRLPAPLTQRLNGIFNAALAEPETRAAFARNGVEGMGGSPEDLANFQRAELSRWREVIRRANITADS